MNEIERVREYCEMPDGFVGGDLFWATTWREALAVIEAVAYADDPNRLDDHAECSEALDAWRAVVRKWEQQQ